MWQWQQVFMLSVAILGVIIKIIILSGPNTTSSYGNNIGELIAIIFTFYVLYSAGFYHGLLY